MQEFTKSLYFIALLLSSIIARVDLQTTHNSLKSGKEVFLDFQPDVYKTFKYISTNAFQASAIIMACSAPIEWNVFQSAIGNNSSWLLLHSSVTVDQGMYPFPHLETQFSSVEYTIKLKMNVVGYGTIVTTNTSDIIALKSSKSIGLQMKWKGENGLVLRWHKHPKRGSLHYGDNFCVVIQTRRPQTNLCNAMSSAEYRRLKNTIEKRLVASFIENYQSLQEQLIYCTNTNLLKLNIDQLLYNVQNNSAAEKVTANLFAFESKTRIPIYLTTNETQYLKPSKILTENKILHVKLSNDPLMLSLKVLQKSFANSILDLYVVPCDVRLHVDVDVNFSGMLLAERKGIMGFGKISVPNVQLKKPYLITLYPNHLNTTVGILKGVQLFATTMSQVYNPFPEMPRLPAVKEYKSLRTCRSITVGWIPPTGLRSGTYCIVVKRGKVDPYVLHGNQCTMNGQLKRGKVTRNDVAKMCKQMKHTARISVLTQKIDKLKPGKFYNIQIMVRKPKGRMLSYEMLQVRTKSNC